MPSRVRRTPFFGRIRERSFLVEEIRSGTRLITLTGPSGMGKTRLAVELMEDLATALPEIGSRHFCSLEGAQTRSDIEASVARMMGLSGASELRLARALGLSGRTLLVLDNVDGLARAAAPLVTELLDSQSELQILITSLVPLDIDAEVRFELGQLETLDAVALYLDRVHRLQANRDPDVDRVAVEELVERLDRIPLAIELAAARSTVLPPRALLAQINQRFDLLRTGRPGRHGSLYEALTLTWELLLPLERLALARASVFVGGFSLEAAEAILGGESADVLSLLDGLRSKALLELDESGEPRFSPYESVREYSARRLVDSPEEEAECLRRHLDFFLREGERHLARISGPEGAASIRWLMEERENLLAAHRRFAAIDPDASARVGYALGAVLEFAGPHPAELEILSSVHRTAEAGAVPRVLLEVGRLLAHALYRHGKIADARATLEASLVKARELGMRHEEGRLLVVASLLAIRTGDHRCASEALEEVLAVAREVGDPALEARGLLGKGMVEESRSAFAPALANTEQALGLYRRLGNHEMEATALLGLGAIWSHQLQFRRAREATEHARSVYQRIGDRSGEGYALINLGAIHLTAGRIDEAEGFTTEGFALEGSKGRRLFEAQGFLNLGLIALERGELRLAEHRLLTATSIYDEYEEKRHRARTLMFVAATEAFLGRSAEARRSLEEARDYFAGIGDQSSLAAFEVFEGILEASEAKRISARLGAKSPESAALIERARDRLARITSGTLPPTTALGIGSRILERALGESERDGGSGPPGRMCLGPEARWFEVDDGERVDLRRRHALRAILRGLAEHRVVAPGAGLSLSELFRLGWPGEEILADSASKRVYTAIWSLRSLGLSSALVHQGEGYMIDPSVTVTLAG